MFGWLRRIFSRQAAREAEQKPARSDASARPPNVPVTLPPGAERHNETAENYPTLGAPDPAAHLTSAVPALPHWLARMPERIAFIDTETTGLYERDRIVSLAVILLKTAGLANEKFNMEYVHVVCDPGRVSHPAAEKIHGYTDWQLRQQETFAESADAIMSLLAGADLIVAHNVDFDVSFVNRELRAIGRPMLTTPTYCTMEACREEEDFRAATLSYAASKLGLKRTTRHHSALEDAWLAMMIYLWLRGCPTRFPFSAIPETEPKNWREVPPEPIGPLPRRKKVPPLEPKARVRTEPDATQLSASTRPARGTRPQVPNLERLANAMRRLPAEDAFTEAAVCLRKQIRELAKADLDARGEVDRLYRLAQQHAFLYGTRSLGWIHPLNRADARAGLYPYLVASLATADDLEAVVLPYAEVGFLHLPLLNKTDLKRLVDTFGEPAQHVMPRERHMKIWKRYRREARMRAEAEQQLPGATG